MSRQHTIPVLAVLEAASVTGPAKNLIAFCSWTRSPEAAAAPVRLDLTLATFCRAPAVDGAGNGFVEAARAAGVPVVPIAERGRFDRAVLPALRELCARIGPAVVQSHNVKSHFLIKSAGLHRGRTWLAFHHGYTATDLKMHAYNQLDRWSLRSADRVVTVCGPFARHLAASRGVAPERIRVLHNSVPPALAAEPARAAALRAELGLRPDAPVILTIGRMSKEKGHADLMHALAALHASAPDRPWQTLIAGDGPERAAVEALAGELGIRGRIVFAGFRRDAIALYGIADVFVLPSHSEGSPNVLLEAMAARVPVAATAVGGTPEIVASGETALLTPPRRPAQLAAVLAQLLDDADLRARLSAAALARASMEFSPAAWRHKLISIYIEALGLGNG